MQVRAVVGIESRVGFSPPILCLVHLKNYDFEFVSPAPLDSETLSNWGI